MNEEQLNMSNYFDEPPEDTAEQEHEEYIYKSLKTSTCLICGKPVPDYEPKMCCDGRECGCHGLPIEPCVCSKECDRAVYDYIGKPFDERRKLAGIKKWKRKRRSIHQ